MSSTGKNVEDDHRNTQPNYAERQRQRAEAARGHEHAVPSQATRERR